MAVAPRAHAAPSGTVAARWRARGSGQRRTASQVALDRGLHEFLREHVPSSVAHTGGEPFAAHLAGVQSVLRGWGGVPEDTCTAGLLHSVYGTEGFAGHKMPFTARPLVREAAGGAAERLAWAFCVADRSSFDRLATDTSVPYDADVERAMRARPELGAFEVVLGPGEFRQLVVLTVADWLEQVEGAAQTTNEGYGWGLGDAWGYRREAYKVMAGRLAGELRLTDAAEMHSEVYNAEPCASRGVHQPVTPPLTDAAREAREALASVAL